NGTLIFTSANTYSTLPPPFPAFTHIVDGVLQIQDSRGLGGTNCLVEDSATLALAIDDIPDSVTGTTNTLVVSNHLFLTGTGFAGVGGLLSKSGINPYAGIIDLSGSVASVGVNPDPNPTSDQGYFPTFNTVAGITGVAVSGDFSLTVLGGFAGGR